jgi:hypothetical protein
LNDKDEIDLVCAHFREEGFVVELIPERPGISKTPDLRLSNSAGNIVAHCEVKSTRDNWLRELWEKAEPGQTSVGGSRPDPVFNRIGRNLLKAAVQFSEYQPSADFPTLVVLVNYDTAASFNDLVETLTGKLLLQGNKFAYTRPVDPSWIAPALAAIDAVGWINARRPMKPVWFFNRRSLDLEKRTTSLLGMKIGVRV